MVRGIVSGRVEFVSQLSCARVRTYLFASSPITRTNNTGAYERAHHCAELLGGDEAREAFQKRLW